MKTGIVLGLLVGIAFATNLKSENVEYEYTIDGRTLTGLHDFQQQFSGMLYQARLKVQPKSQEKWMCQIYSPKVAKVHTHLPQGWDSHIPESELSWQQLEISSKPFEVVIKSGVISDLIVSKDVKNWEANMIKGIMSQFQLDIKAKEFISSPLNVFSQDQSRPSAVFKTMEETISGNTETLYEIHPIDEFALDAGYVQLTSENPQNVFEVLKHKNYTNNEELPMYSFGFGDNSQWVPGTNQMGGFFARNTFTRAILTGDIDRHVLRNCSTVNKIVVSPTMIDQQKGMVVSAIWVKLETESTPSQPLEEVHQPQRLGNLVYTYDAPNSGLNQVRGKKLMDYKQKHHYDDLESERLMHLRQRRSIEKESEQYFENEQPRINEAPGSPLLPFSVGCKGYPVKKCVDISKTIQKLCWEIGTDLEDSDKICEADSLNKFTILTSLIRTLNTEELQKVANVLYTQFTEKSKRAAWKTFRDAVAECGTGPALVVIHEWIVSEKVANKEAAYLISTMATSARQPTLDYLKNYFELVKQPTVQSQWPLNDTAVITFGALLRRSVISYEGSMRQYPVNSFGRFSTEKELKFVIETVIPYFKEKLQESISEAQTHKIHAYIRAIGNIGHPKCLEAFEPYLEGKKQASQFQRLYMIAAMDKLVENYRKVARSVLFKVYQNPGESQEVRVAAVYALMKAEPTTEMLQLMASRTHIEKDQHVNSAVTSSIEQLTTLKSAKWAKVRNAAIAAQPLLKRKNYGAQSGKIHVLQYAYDNLNSMYKDTIKTIGSEDSLLPKGIKMTFREHLNGASHRWYYWQAAVSSIKELFHIAAEQTAGYEEKQREQNQQSGQQEQNPWSSQNIARLLNMRADEMEQLEGQIYMETDIPFGMLAFDNQTLEHLPEFLREIEDELREGKKIDFVKITNNWERAISFPTEMGFPFLFSYDTPRLIHIDGTVKASSNPKVSQDGKLHKPEKVELRIDASILLHSKVQGRLSFYTPYDHQQYIAAYDKMVHVAIPLNGNVDVDVKEMQVKAEIDVKRPNGDDKLIGYSTTPFTSVVDLTNFQPLAKHPNTQVMRGLDNRRFEHTVGKKSTGIALRVEMDHPRQFIDSSYFIEQMRSPNLAKMFWSLWNDGAIQRSKIAIYVDSEKTTTRKMVVGLGYQRKYTQEPQQESSMDYKQFSEAEDSKTRQHVLRERVSTGIKNVESKTYDAYIKFQGEDNIEYIVTGGFGKSNVDPKSRLIVYYKKASDKKDIKPYGFSFDATSEIPNTNALDLEYSMQTEPKFQTRWTLHFGERKEKLSKLQGLVKFERSNERKEYLQQQPKYSQCQREMREGNKQLQACANVTMEANLLDRIDANIQYRNLGDDFKHYIRTVYDFLRMKYFLNIEQREQQSEESDEVIVRARFDNDLRSVNVSMRTEGVNTTIKNIPLNEYAKRVFVQHPVFHMKNRLISYITGLQTFRPSCIVDKTRVATFNNRTYPVDMSNHWTVMFQYVPQEARHGGQMRTVHDQLKSQIENLVVLVRANAQQQKEVKLTLSTPETKFKVVDVTMTPKQGSVEVTVDGQKVPVSDKQSYDVYGDYIQIYVLPNDEVKVEVRGQFYVIFDGERVRLSVMDGGYRNSVRGICGPLNDEPAEDFLTSQNCYVKNSDYEKFWKSYEINSQEGKSIRNAFAGRTPECAEKVTPIYANVISDLDAFRHESDQNAKRCSIFQTRYLEQNGHICFTTYAVPVCHSRCEPQGVLRKNVPVHCIPKTNVAQLWKTQIDKGASPDFSHKTVTKTIPMELPQTCTK